MGTGQTFEQKSLLSVFCIWFHITLWNHIAWMLQRCWICVLLSDLRTCSHHVIVHDGFMDGHLLSGLHYAKGSGPRLQREIFQILHCRQSLRLPVP